MEHESDIVYLGRRAFEERRAAVRSGNRVVRDVHLEFASAYEFRLYLLREQASPQAPHPRAVAKLLATERCESNRQSDRQNDIIIEQLTDR